MQSRFAKANQQMTVDSIDSFAFGGSFPSPLGDRVAMATLTCECVTLVDIEVVRFLNACEKSGTELIHCSPYIREWMAREQYEIYVRTQSKKGKMKR